MKKLIFGNIIFIMSLVFVGCGDDCDPGLLPEDDRIIVNLVNANGTGFLKYANNGLPDSVKVTNINTNAVVNRFLLADSLLIIEEYNKVGGAVTRYKISKGTILKPDTIEVTVARTNVDDACGTDFDVARFGSFKINNVTKCTNCQANTIISHTR